jgi:hypothetical protein
VTRQVAVGTVFDIGKSQINEATLSERAPIKLSGVELLAHLNGLDARAVVSGSWPRTDFHYRPVHYAVAKDGKRFLVNRYVPPDHVSPLTIVLHATAEPPR